MRAIRDEPGAGGMGVERGDGRWWQAVKKPAGL